MIGDVAVWLKPHACLNPEQPPSASNQFDLGCNGCLIALQAATAAPPPAGSFDGWWRSRDEIAQMLADRAVIYPSSK